MSDGIRVIKLSECTTYVGKGRLTKVLLDADKGVDTFSCVRVLFPPGEASEPHAKSETIEVVIVLRGVLTLLTDDGEHEVPSGGVAVIPRGTRHIHANRTDDHVEILVLLTPPGPEQVFKERSPLGEVAHDADKIREIERKNT
jgi:quercetin dioxygenase-like cupin family protein